MAKGRRHTGGTSASAPWWKGAVIYQVYPRSFQDSDGDGIGDLAGIIARLPYIAALGVDALWLSPIFRSPMKDFGYDVADHKAIDPLFGTLADFDLLVARAHALGLRVLLDQVWSHTSDEHPWFAVSRASRVNHHADWYVWADPKPDGSPPSNWQSVFGGPAWTWDARRSQYYLHNFLAAQPDLNLHNPEVVDAVLDIACFWLARGVDGFRLDAINFALHDPALRNNPPAPDRSRPKTRPFDFQLPRHNMNHPGVPTLLEKVRALLDANGGAFAFAEVVGPDSLAQMRAFTRPGRLHSAYGFAFLHAAQLTPARVVQAMADWPPRPGVGWPSWTFSNHDAPRAVSRWAPPGMRDQMARMLLALLLSLRGNIILYQGEELGLSQVDVPFARLQDPEAIANWPLTLSRDGARTPMPWQKAAPHAGFSTAEPWLPLGPDHGPLAVDAQEQDKGSVLALTRALVALRKAQPALRLGRFEPVHADDSLLVFDRQRGRARLRCLFNLSAAQLVGHSHSAGPALLQGNGAGPAALPPLAWRIEQAA
ncbi:alpha-amylase family glycosyl hydrolase [Thermaurantiacus sp.]